ncbi:reverse transcriptase domain-containing protein [Tanacetum coccineum]|uniref:Reverse transcriptase domain-containing protein n=1 Tax=Tanacetum coccineum TaxID=301880 RepID=A0ABQ4WSH0_9ASTR
MKCAEVHRTSYEVRRTLDDHVSLNDGFKSEGQWDGSKFRDIADSGKKKETKAFLLSIEWKRRKLVNDTSLLALWVFIINLEEDDVEPRVVLVRSFLRFAKEIVDFGNMIITIYPDLVSFNDDFDDDWEAILDSVDISDLPQLDVTDVPPFVCNMGKSSQNKKRSCGNYKMSYSDKGPSLIVEKPLTQEEVSQEYMEMDIYERILILNESRPIIETLKFNDQHKKLLDSVLLDKLKLDGKLNLKRCSHLRSYYKAIREKNNPRFILPIRREAKFDFHALADTGSNINVIPYHIYAKLGRDQVKLVNQKITMLDNSKAEPMGILNDVNHGESDSDDEEEYYLERDKNGKPFYGPNRAKYLSCDDLMCDNHDLAGVGNQSIECDHLNKIWNGGEFG